MRIRGFLLLGLCGLLALHAFRFFQPVDDAFISFRYAENLAAGKGPVFNEGEQVEGYTNFLWVLLAASPAMAMWARGRMEAPLFSFLALVMAWHWAKDSGKSRSPWR